MVRVNSVTKPLPAFFISFFILYTLFLLSIDNGLPTTRNNYIFLSSLFLLFGLIKFPRKLVINEFLFYIWGGLLLIHLSYSSINHFPTNEFLNRDFFRFNHYIFLLGYVFLFRSNRLNFYLILGCYLLILHSFFFHLTSEKSAPMIPYLIVGFYLSHKNSTIRVSIGSGTLFLVLGFLFLSIFFTSPDLVQGWLSYLLLVVGVFGFIGFCNLDKLARGMFEKVLGGIFLYQGIVILSYISYRAITSVDDYSRVILQLPISSLGALSLVVLLLSANSFLEGFSDFSNNYFKVTVSILNLGIYFPILVISHSRTSYVSCLLGVVLLTGMYLYSHKDKFVRSKKWMLSSIIIFTAIVISGLIIVSKKNVSLNTLSIRFSIWNAHVQTSWENNFWFGMGMLPEWKIFYMLSSNLNENVLSTIQSYIEEFQSFPPGHSLYVQIFSSLGILGLILYFSLIGSILIKIYSTKRFQYLPILLAFSVHELTDYHLTEYPVFFPMLFIFSSLYSHKYKTGKRLWFYGNSILMLFFTTLSIFVVLQSTIVENHKRDLSGHFIFSNLQYATPIVGSNPKNIKWSHSGLDFISELIPERNHVFLKMLYYQFQMESDPKNREKYLEYQRKCFAMASFDTRCKGTL